MSKKEEVGIKDDVTVLAGRINEFSREFERLQKIEARIRDKIKLFEEQKSIAMHLWNMQSCPANSLAYIALKSTIDDIDGKILALNKLLGE